MLLNHYVIIVIVISIFIIIFAACVGSSGTNTDLRERLALVYSGLSTAYTNSVPVLKFDATAVNSRLKKFVI